MSKVQANRYELGSAANSYIARSDYNIGIYTDETLRLNIDTTGNTTSNGDISFDSSDRGIVLQAANGSFYRIVVANDGTLFTEIV